MKKEGLVSRSTVRGRAFSRKGSVVWKVLVVGTVATLATVFVELSIASAGPHAGDSNPPVDSANQLVPSTSAVRTSENASSSVGCSSANLPSGSPSTSVVPTAPQNNQAGIFSLFSDNLGANAAITTATNVLGPQGDHYNVNSSADTAPGTGNANLQSFLNLAKDSVIVLNTHGKCFVPSNLPKPTPCTLPKTPAGQERWWTVPQPADSNEVNTCALIQSEVQSFTLQSNVPYFAVQSFPYHSTSPNPIIRLIPLISQYFGTMEVASGAMNAFQQSMSEARQAGIPTKDVKIALDNNVATNGKSGGAASYEWDMYLSGPTIEKLFANSNIALVDAEVCTSIYMAPYLQATAYFGYGQCASGDNVSSNSQNLFDRLAGLQSYRSGAEGSDGLINVGTSSQTPPPLSTLVADDWRNSTGAWMGGGWQGSNCTTHACYSGGFMLYPTSDPVVLTPAIDWEGGSSSSSGGSTTFAFDAEMAQPPRVTQESPQGSCPGGQLQQTWSPGGSNEPNLTLSINVPNPGRVNAGLYPITIQAAQTLATPGTGVNDQLDGNQMPGSIYQTSGEVPNTDNFLYPIGVNCGQSQGGGGG
jgi:hypothetical protein